MAKSTPSKSTRWKGNMVTRSIGNSVFIHIHTTKPLVQFSDGFEKVTLTREELNKANEILSKEVSNG